LDNALAAQVGARLPREDAFGTAAMRGRADSFEESADGAAWREPVARECARRGSNLGFSGPAQTKRSRRNALWCRGFDDCVAHGAFLRCDRGLVFPSRVAGEASGPHVFEPRRRLQVQATPIFAKLPDISVSQWAMIWTTSPSR